MKKLIRRLPRFVEADRALATLAGRETWTREQFDAYQLSSINALWQHAVESVSYYQRLHRERNLPRRFDDLSHIHRSVPVLSKASVRADPDSFRSSAKTSGFWCRTGGSTGTPMRVYWDRAAHRSH